MNIPRAESKLRLQAFHTHPPSIALVPGFWCKNCPKKKETRVTRRKRP